ncbi:MAG: flagellar protein FlgN [Firmicutes bacterium]|nr:flagellar protein FlgN [Bacillota bacterium]
MKRMADLDALRQTLTAENEIIIRLIELGEAKRAVLNNAEQVAGIAREEEQCLLKLDALERARLTLMQQLGGDQTGAGFVEQLEPEGGGLPELLETLAANLRQLQAVNELNQQLLRESLQFVQFSLNVLSGDVAVTYDRTGSSPSGKSTFDRKV